MKRNKFGEPRPLGVDEIIEAHEETGCDISQSYCDIIDGPESDGQGGHGFSAEIMTDQGSICTRAYGTERELIDDLRKAGVEVNV